jgi:hypothetical protein
VGYKVRGTEIGKVGADLTRLWRENLQWSFDAMEKYRWYYLDNPQGKGAAFLLDVDDGSEPVGAVGLGVRRFAVLGKNALGTIFVDLAVDRRHRTLFPAMMLQRAARRHSQQNFDFAFGFPNDSAVGVFVKMGYRRTVRMKRLVRVLRHTSYVERVVPSAALAGLGGMMLDGLSRLRDLFQTVSGAAPVELQWVDDVDERFDQLWETARLSYPVVGYRGADFVRWRLLQSPARRCRLATLVHRHTGELQAYAAVARDDQVADLVDIFGQPESLFVLLLLLGPELRAAGFESASMRIGAPVWITDLLGRVGFQVREVGNALVVDALQHPAGATVLDPDSWFLTEADEDG